MTTQPPSPDQTETKTPLLTPSQILSQLGVEPIQAYLSEGGKRDRPWLISKTQSHTPTFEIEGQSYPAHPLYIAAITASEALRASMLTSDIPAKPSPTFSRFEESPDATSLADIARGEIHFELQQVFTEKRAKEVTDNTTVPTLNSLFAGKQVRILDTGPDGEITIDTIITCERIHTDPSGDLNLVTTDDCGYQFLPEEITDTSVSCNFAYTLNPGRTRTISLAA